MTALLTQRARPLWAALPGTPLGVAFLISATMSRAKDRRPRDASAFLARLDHAWGRAGRDREAYLAAYMASIRAGRGFDSLLPRRGTSILLAAFVAFSSGAAAVGLLLALRLMR